MDIMHAWKRSRLLDPKHPVITSISYQSAIHGSYL